jgi:hypothetical protein
MFFRGGMVRASFYWLLYMFWLHKDRHSSNYCPLWWCPQTFKSYWTCGSHSYIQLFKWIRVLKKYIKLLKSWNLSIYMFFFLYKIYFWGVSTFVHMYQYTIYRQNFQAYTLTYFLTCSFGQLTKISTCPTQFVQNVLVIVSKTLSHPVILILTEIMIMTTLINKLTYT